MNQKYRVHEVAKDLNVPSNEVIDLLVQYFGTTKKHQTALTVEELNIVFEHFTAANQVKSFSEYFDIAAEKAKEKAEAEKRLKAEAEARLKAEAEEKARAEAEEKARAEAAAIAETEAKAKAEAEARLKAEAEAELKAKAEAMAKAEAEKRAKADAERQISAETEKNEKAVAEKQVKSGNKHSGINSDKKNESEINTVKERAEKPNGSKMRNDNKKSGNNQYNSAKNKPHNTVKRAVTPAVNVGSIKTNEPPVIHRHKGETVQRGEQVVRHVDTRGSYVELDKYNERYEQIAPTQAKTQKDHQARKQKINQKSHIKNRTQHSVKRETEAEKLKRLELERARKQQLKVMIPDEIVVSELAARLKVTASQVIKKLMGLGVMAGINETIDFDTASLVAIELGAKVEKEIIVTIEERLFDETEDTDDNLEPRSPIVVVMGHVDHGKTSLLDKIRNSDVTSTEAGGITQHIGAYRVNAGGKEITFLDTPGHEAFTSMRARGASVTDIAILVVAADDGIMPQTVEAINHAKAANVSIIVAINKIDKETADPQRVKQELTEHGLVTEEWGGDTICINVSAKTGQGIDELLEMINLVADVQELTANPNRLAKGTVIEARLDKGRGPIATILVQSGTLHTGDIIIAGTAVGRVRLMYSDKGQAVTEAGPCVPVEIMGLAEVPSAGEPFNAVENEKLARELVEKRKHEAKQLHFNSYQKVTLDNLFSQIEQGEVKELPIIVKADVQGSAEAVKQSLEKLSNKEVRVRVIHNGVGAVSESDVMLANASNAIIVGFNVRPHPQAAVNAERDGIDVRLYRIIYDAIEEIGTAMKGMLAPKQREVQQARVEVRQVFKVSSVGTIAGCYVLDGKVNRNCKIRVVRDGIVIAEDEIDSLRRFKDDVKEVASGYECGIGLLKYNDIRENDIFEAFIIEEYRE